MNNLLQLKGDFYQRSNTNRPGPPTLPTGVSVTSERLTEMLDNLLNLQSYWRKETLIDGCLISVRYTRVIPKSKRISGFLTRGSISANDSIVGAEFTSGGIRKHIITHFVQIPLLDETIKRVNSSIRILDDVFSGVISADQLKNINIYDIDYKQYAIAKTNFMKIIADSPFIEEFFILDKKADATRRTVITLYKTTSNIVELLRRIGINLLPGRIVDETTVLLESDQIKMLNSKASYLISMSTSDISKLSIDDFLEHSNPRQITIPKPNGEPVVGVIDTMFDENVYFAEWVSFEKVIDDEIPIDSRDFIHGTSVTSIIVDGPTIDPELDDGCGRFQVKHFGVASSRQFSSFEIMKSIDEIVKKHTEIKVWNLSLGSYDEINDNFISLEGSILDRIQYENDVIFVVSGTNKPIGFNGSMKIGSPADSINSIVVNSVDFEGNPAVYSRNGIVLSFFNKPDVCFYGGTPERRLRVCDPFGERFVMGTSFAAPWVTRKIAYLIEVLGFSREVAKALLIDSATGWNEKNTIEEASLIGHGILPKHINEMLNTPDDEIKFVLSGISEKFDTYNYNIPVPLHKNEHPFISKATLCYYPKCSRNQGVDYTNTELDVKFGRIDDEGKVKSIDNNNQSDQTQSHYLRETNARRLFRKWDNSKHIREVYTPRKKPKKSYSNKMWGISVKTKERLSAGDGNGIRFGLVVTLKEIYGVNRIEDFIRQCSLKMWLVNRIDVKNKVEIYNKMNEEVTFD